MREPGAGMPVHHQEEHAHPGAGHVSLYQHPPVVRQPAGELRARGGGVVDPEHAAGGPGAPVHGIGLEPERPAEPRQLLRRWRLTLDDEPGWKVGIALEGGHQIPPC